MGRLKIFVVAWRESRGWVDPQPSHDTEDRLHDDTFNICPINSRGVNLYLYLEIDRGSR